MNSVENVTKLTNELVASYARLGGINHLDGKNLPSKRAVTDITCDLLRLLFPGFFDEKLVHSSETKAETAALLDSRLNTPAPTGRHPDRFSKRKARRKPATNTTRKQAGNLPE